MSKKKTPKDFGRLDAIVDSLFPDLEEMTSEEVEALLSEGGCDLERQRQKLNELARGMARARRAEGKLSPPYMQRIIEQTGDASVLPRKPKDALRKAQQQLSSLFSRKKGLSRLEIVHAYRKEKGGKITENDRALIESLEDDLRKRAEDGDE